MFKSILRDRLLIFLFFLAVLIKLFSLNEGWVERYYTYGFYPVLAKTLRFLLGWIPVSIGDLVYTAAFIWLVLKTWKLLRVLAKRQVKDYLSWILFRKFLKLVLWVYVIFNVFWGLNYNRQGIASQLGLAVRTYSKEELLQLTQVLQQRLNVNAAQVDTVKRLELNRNARLIDEGVKNFETLSSQYPFLTYRPVSVKASLFSPVGHYFGFSGYFNPFTSEAQMNTSEPVFVKPFVIDHEIAHQLGYGKENEASFVSFLACKTSGNVDFRYSLYYELYFNALAEYATTFDTTTLKQLRQSLHPRARLDRIAERQFRMRRKNNVSPYVSDFYNNYLKMNNQPKGLATYNEVTAWLIAYMKKYGVEEM